MQIDAALHHQIAVDANNSTWEILGKALDEISEGDAEEMTRRAYAAAYHWQRAEGSNPTNEARASWLLLRAWVTQNWRTIISRLPAKFSFLTRMISNSLNQTSM